MAKLSRRYVYEKTEREVTKWAERMIHERRIDKPPNGKNNFPYYLDKYLEHLKFQVR